MLYAIVGLVRLGLPKSDLIAASETHHDLIFTFLAGEIIIRAVDSACCTIILLPLTLSAEIYGL